jgi:hypothetical protein
MLTILRLLSRLGNVAQGVGSLAEHPVGQA